MATPQITTTPQGAGTPVFGDNGLRGTVVPPAGGVRAGAAVEVALADGQRVMVPVTLLQARADGSYYVPLGPGDISAAAAAPPAVADADAGTLQVIPLVAEQIEIHKRRVETGTVRVTKSVETHDEVVDVALQREDVTVERVPVERFVTEVPAVRHEGDVMIVPVMEEVLVVEKRLMVREELRLTTRRTETHEPRTVTLRKEMAHVERIPLT